MTREETKNIIMFISGSYPNFKPLDLTETVNSWATVFSNFDVEQVKLLVKAYIVSNESGFPPSISDIIKIYRMTVEPQELNEMEAWALVAKALRNGGYRALEEYEKLPPALQKAVGTHEQLRNWALDENFNEEVAKSNFLRTYRTEVKRERELAKMPSDVRRLVETVNRNSYKAQIEDKRKEAIKSLSERKESEIKALEDKREGVPMLERCKQRMEDMRNEQNNGC